MELFFSFFFFLSVYISRKKKPFFLKDLLSHCLNEEIFLFLADSCTKFTRSGVFFLKYLFLVSFKKSWAWNICQFFRTHGRIFILLIVGCEMCGKIPAMGLSQLKPFSLTSEGLTCKLYSSPVSFQGYFIREASQPYLLIFYIKTELMSCASPDELAELLQLQGDLTPANINAKAWLQSCQTHI